MIDRAALRLLAAHGLGAEEDDLPQTSVQYAGEQEDGLPNENLYEYTDDLVEASKGGITDTYGDPSMDPQWLNYGPTESKPNAQKSLNGSALEACLRVLGDRLSSESDPLTRDQENYGSGSHLKEAATEVDAFGGGKMSREAYNRWFRSLPISRQREIRQRRHEMANKPRELKVPEKVDDPQLQHAVQALKIWGQDTNILAQIISSWYAGHYMGDDWNTRGKYNMIGPMAKQSVRAAFIKTMAYVGRNFPTKLGPVAYRVTDMMNGRPVEGKKQILDLGPRSILSFSQTVSAVEKFANGISRKNNLAEPVPRMVVKVPLTSNNYIATTATIVAFVKLVANNTEALGVYRPWWKKAWVALRKFAGQDEVLMYFKDPHKVPAVITTLLPDNTKVEVNAVEAGVEDLLILDPETCSTYSRESNSNGNTTVNQALEAVAVQDGDFDAHGYRGADRLVTDDPDTNGYLNVHAKRKTKSKHPPPPKKHKRTKHKYPDDLDDPTWEYLASLESEEATDFGEEVLSDADPSLWNMANQPLGQMG